MCESVKLTVFDWWVQCSSRNSGELNFTACFIQMIRSLIPPVSMSKNNPKTFILPQPGRGHKTCEFFILFMYFILFYFIFLYWFWQQWCKTANKLQRTVGVTLHVPHPAPIPLEYTGVEVILQSILEHACPCFALSNFRRRVWEREGENNVAACDSVCTDSSLPPLLPVKYPQILLAAAAAAAAVIFIPVFLWASTIW